MSNTKRIGILTRGRRLSRTQRGHSRRLKAANRHGYEVVGFLKGYEGLVDPVCYVPLTYKNTTGILDKGGTILGSTNKGRFAATVGVNDRLELDPELVAGVKTTVEQLNLSGLICVGGDGSLAVSQQFHEQGIPVVGVPKTIDNDLSSTAFTFGFFHAGGLCHRSVDRLHTTAASHERVMVLEVMGRHAGWIGLYCGIAGGGDVILIPEIDWSFDNVCQAIIEREQKGKHFTLIVVSEGAKLPNGDMVTKERRKEQQQVRLGGVGNVIGYEIEKRLGKETRVVVLGHLQRGGAPTTFDRVIATQYGAHAVRLVVEQKFGHMVCYNPPAMNSVPIIDAIQLAAVDPNSSAVQSARAMGISFGDDNNEPPFQLPPKTSIESELPAIPSGNGKAKKVLVHV